MPIRSRRLGDSATRRLGGTRRGITLLEAVAAIAIVGMTAVGALEAVGGGMRTAERAKRAIEVEALATSRLEVMNLLTDQELQSLPDSIEDGKFETIIRHLRIIRDESLDTKRDSAFREMLETWINAGTVQIKRGDGPR